jgi:hypothetical protein
VSAFLKACLPALLWGAAIMILCGIPGNDLPELTFLQWLRPDKVVHVIMFGILSILLLRGFSRQNRFERLHLQPKTFAVIYAILYGILTEILQSAVFVNRMGDLRDALADALGACLGIWIFYIFARSNASDLKENAAERLKQKE